MPAASIVGAANGLIFPLGFAMADRAGLELRHVRAAQAGLYQAENALEPLLRCPAQLRQVNLFRILLRFLLKMVLYLLPAHS